jgi:hypothetical protein
MPLTEQSVRSLQESMDKLAARIGDALRLGREASGTASGGLRDIPRPQSRFEGLQTLSGGVPGISQGRQITAADLRNLLGRREGESSGMASPPLQAPPQQQQRLPLEAPERALPRPTLEFPLPPRAPEQRRQQLEQPPGYDRQTGPAPASASMGMQMAPSASRPAPPPAMLERSGPAGAPSLAAAPQGRSDSEGIRRMVELLGDMKKSIDNLSDTMSQEKPQKQAPTTAVNTTVRDKNNEGQPDRPRGRSARDLAALTQLRAR